MTQNGLLQPSPVAAVVIGRNEGDRLVRCLKSLHGQAAPIVYVDSGSTDSSVESAKALGAEVVSLDMTQPFTAARARNAGLSVLKDVDIDFVQMIDGVCDLYPSWIETAPSRKRSRNAQYASSTPTMTLPAKQRCPVEP